MTVNDIKKLIEEPCNPNPVEWAMNAQDIFDELDMLNNEVIDCINSITFFNGADNYNNLLIVYLKRALKKIEKSSDIKIKGDSVVMTKENVFIVYSHKHADIMREIKEFVRDNLGFEPKTLDISECTGSVWDAFSEKSQDCQKAIIVMAEDDKVVSDDSEYMQARPNVFIELGYMIHKCGLNNVTIVCSENCNIPSDIGGLIHVVYKSDRWTESLRKQLNR